MIHFRIVTADAEELYVTETNEHTDLFWALKGAGNGNFGVVTEIKIRIFPHEGIETWGEVAIPFQDYDHAGAIFQKYINNLTMDEQDL